MTNRQQRRASVAEFKRDAAGDYLDTYMLPSDAPIINPLLQRATSVWRANISTRRPKCIACRAGFSDDARVGAYLCAVPSGAPSTATVSGLCADCWLNLSDEVVKAAALKVIRRVMPTATFDPEPPR
jgi:hypothetical protein